MWVPSLGREDPLEEEMATHSSIVAWKVPWMAEPRELQSSGLKESDMTEQLSSHTDKTIRLRGNQVNLHDLGLGKAFLDTTVEVQQTKENKK